jgi:hypothetical protein
MRVSTHASTRVPSPAMPGPCHVASNAGMPLLLRNMGMAQIAAVPPIVRFRPQANVRRTGP